MDNEFYQKLLTTTRSEWEAERVSLQSSILHGLNSKASSFESRELIEKGINAAQERIDYIDSVLDKHYTDMCIRCAHKTPTEHHAEQAKGCIKCFEVSIYNAIANLDDEDRERVERQLIDEGE